MTRLRRVLMLLTAAAAFAVVAASPALGEPVKQRVGDLTIVASGSGQKITHGASSTEFILALPDGSTCPGDSANDDWRTQGFLAPEGLDPSTLQYNAVGAVGPGVFPLYEVNTRSYRHELLEPNDKAGEPGHIPRLPAMSFATYPPDYVPPGHYVIGIACTYFRQLDKYWTVDVDVVKDTSDSPAELTWSIVGSAPASSGGGSNRTPVVIALVAAAGVAAFFIIRRSRRTAGSLQLAKEKP